jgi:hypothetical protein
MSPVDKNEIVRRSNAMETAGLIFLGFKLADSVPEHHILKDGVLFARPKQDDSRSGEAFAHLHASMLRKKVVAIAELMRRPKTQPSKLVTVWPVEHAAAGWGVSSASVVPEEQQGTPGMLVVPMPFQDETRYMEPDAADKAAQEGESIVTQEQVEAARSWILKRQLSDAVIGESSIFANTPLSRVWDYIERAALDQVKPTETEEPDAIMIDEASGISELERLKSLLPIEEENAPTKKSKSRVVKVLKELPPDESDVDWMELYRYQQLSSAKVDQLKSFLKSVGEKSTGKKADLIDRARPYIERELEEEIRRKQLEQNGAAL